MYKKIFLSLLILVLLTGCTGVQKSPDEKIQKKYTKAVWMSYIELSQLTKSSSESDFKSEINRSFKDLSDKGFNRVSVQVRPFADAFYRSEIFPVSKYAFGEEGGELEYDPLEIICNIAKKHNIEIEAWINPYRISADNDISALSSKSLAKKYENTDSLIICDKGIFFSPASEEARDIIVSGVKEVIDNYEVSSVCFDDYFYPESDIETDEGTYNEYLDSGGNLSLEDWRRENVSTLIKEVYSAVKSADKGITFGVSPQSSFTDNYNSLYADVYKWCTQEGFIDYINPQIYFGFKNENQPFMKTTREWLKTAECDLFISLPLYKQGKEDKYAGEFGINEFAEENDIISRQVKYLSKLEEIDGYYIYSYSFLGDNEESSNLYSAMQNSSL